MKRMVGVILLLLLLPSCAAVMAGTAIYGVHRYRVGQAEQEKQHAEAMALEKQRLELLKKQTELEEARVRK